METLGHASVHTHISLFLFSSGNTQSYMHKHLPSHLDFCVVADDRMVLPFFPFPCTLSLFSCFPTLPIVVRIIQSSIGVEGAHEVKKHATIQDCLGYDITEGAWCQTVVVVDLRRIVLWGFREGAWGGTQGGRVFVVGGKLWLTGSPPFSNNSSWERGWEGGGDEEQQCTGLSRRSLSSACKWSSVSSTSYWRSQSGQ